MITIDHVRAALALEDFNSQAAHLKMAPVPRGYFGKDDNRRDAAVLILLYPHDDTLHILLTRRTDSLRGHSGQISFPGGKRDPEDVSYRTIALRETCEELGICDTSTLTMLGELTEIYIPVTRFDVYPIVATIDTLPELTPSPAEVAEVLSISVPQLLRADLKKHQTREIMGHQVEIPYYDVNEHVVWGATAIMLSALEHRLRAVLPDSVLNTLTD
ncbi:MAG: NUDIX hydrolase [Aggregatilineales bacterium]